MSGDLEAIRQSLKYRSFLCPLTGKIMQDPVRASDGVMYEKNALRGYIKDHGYVSPSTKEALQKTAFENPIFKKAIEKFLAQYSALRGDQYIAPSVSVSHEFSVFGAETVADSPKTLPFAVTFSSKTPPAGGAGLGASSDASLHIQLVGAPDHKEGFMPALHTLSQDRKSSFHSTKATVGIDFVIRGPFKIWDIARGRDCLGDYGAKTSTSKIHAYLIFGSTDVSLTNSRVSQF